MASKEYELFQKRLANRGLTEMDRMTKGKEDSFNYALIHSYNSETLDKNGVLSKGLINNEKLQLDYDQKTLSTTLASNIEVGDTLYWERTDTNWIVIIHQLTERAYLKFSIKKALYKFKWRNDDGVIWEQWAALLGPVETKISEDNKKGVNFDIGNNTLTLWMGASEGTKTLDRYDKIMVAGKVWKINVVDDITTPKLVILHLIEDFVDEDKDNSAEQIARDYEHMVEEVQVESNYVITGLEETNPIKGLIQTYTIDPTDESAIWSIDNPTLGDILAQDASSITIKFNGSIGSTHLSYSIADVKAATKVIKVKSILG